MTLRELLRKPFVSTPVAQPHDLSGKHIVVTGCSAGSLGYATALQHPGGRSGSYTNVASKGLQGHALIELFRRVAAPLERLMMASAAEGAQTQIHCASSPRACSGSYYVNCETTRSSADSRDVNAASRLWAETQVWLDSAC